MFDYWIFDINIWILDHLLIVRIFLFMFFCFIWCWIDFDSYNLGFLYDISTKLPCGFNIGCIMWNGQPVEHTIYKNRLDLKKSGQIRAGAEECPSYKI